MKTKTRRILSVVLLVALLCSNFAQSNFGFNRILADDTEITSTDENTPEGEILEEEGGQEDGEVLSSPTDAGDQDLNTLGDLPIKVSNEVVIEHSSSATEPILSGQNIVFTTKLTISGKGSWKDGKLTISVPQNIEIDEASLNTEAHNNLQFLSAPVEYDSETRTITVKLEGEKDYAGVYKGIPTGNSFDFSWAGKFPTEITPDGQIASSTASFFANHYDPDEDKIDYYTNVEKTTDVTSKASINWTVAKTLLNGGKAVKEYFTIGEEQTEVYKLEYQIDVYRDETKDADGALDFDYVELTDEILKVNGKDPVQITVSGTKENTLTDGRIISWTKDGANAFVKSVDGDFEKGDFILETQAQGSLKYSLKNKINIKVYYKTEDAVVSGQTTELTNTAKIKVFTTDGKDTAFEGSSIPYIFPERGTGTIAIGIEKLTSNNHKSEGTPFSTTEQLKNAQQPLSYKLKLSNNGEETIDYTVVDDEVIFYNKDGVNLNAEIEKDYWFNSISIPNYNTQASNGIEVWYKDVSGTWQGLGSTGGAAGEEEKWYGLKLVVKGMLAGDIIEGVRVGVVLAQRSQVTEGTAVHEIKNIANAYAEFNGTVVEATKQDDSAIYQVGAATTGVSVVKTIAPVADAENGTTYLNLKDYAANKEVPFNYEISVTNDGNSTIDQVVVNDTGLKFYYNNELLQFNSNDVDFQFSNITVSGMAQSDYEVHHPGKIFTVTLKNLAPQAIVKINFEGTVTRKTGTFLFDKIVNTGLSSFQYGDMNSGDEGRDFSAELPLALEKSISVNKIISQADKFKLAAENDASGYPKPGTGLYARDIPFFYTIVVENTGEVPFEEYILRDPFPTFQYPNNAKAATATDFLELKALFIEAGVEATVYAGGTYNKTTPISGTSVTGGTEYDIAGKNGFHIVYTNAAPGFLSKVRVDATLKQLDVNTFSIADNYTGFTNTAYVSYKEKSTDSPSTEITSQADAYLDIPVVTGDITKTHTVGTARNPIEEMSDKNIQYTINGRLTSNVGLHKIIITDEGPKFLNTAGTAPLASVNPYKFATIESVTIPNFFLKDGSLKNTIAKVYLEYKSLDATGENLSENWIKLDSSEFGPTSTDADFTVKPSAGSNFAQIRIVAENVAYPRESQERLFNDIIINVKFSDLSSLLTLATVNEFKIDNKASIAYELNNGPGNGGWDVDIDSDVFTVYNPTPNITHSKESSTSALARDTVFSAAGLPVTYTLTSINTAESAELNNMYIVDKGIIPAVAETFDYSFKNIDVKITNATTGATLTDIPYSIMASTATATDSTVFDAVWSNSAVGFKSFKVTIGDGTTKVPPNVKVVVTATANITNIGNTITKFTNNSYSYGSYGANNTNTTKIEKSKELSITSTSSKITVTKVVDVASLSYGDLIKGDKELNYTIKATNTGNTGFKTFTINDVLTVNPTTPAATASDYSFGQVTLSSPTDLKGATVTVNYKLFDGSVKTNYADAAGKIKGFDIVITNMPNKYVRADYTFNVNVTLKERNYSQVKLTSIGNKVTGTAANPSGTITYDNKQTATTTISDTGDTNIALAKTATSPAITALQLINATDAGRVPVKYTISNIGYQTATGTGFLPNYTLEDKVVELSSASEVLYTTDTTPAPAPGMLIQTYPKALTSDIFRFDKLVFEALKGEESTVLDVTVKVFDGNAVIDSGETFTWEYGQSLTITGADVGGKSIAGFAATYRGGAVPRSFIGNKVNVEGSFGGSISENEMKKLTKITNNARAFVEYGAPKGTQEAKAPASVTVSPLIEPTFKFTKTAPANLEMTSLHSGDQKVKFDIDIYNTASNTPINFEMKDEKIKFFDATPNDISGSFEYYLEGATLALTNSNSQLLSKYADAKGISSDTELVVDFLDNNGAVIYSETWSAKELTKQIVLTDALSQEAKGIQVTGNNIGKDFGVKISLNALIKQVDIDKIIGSNLNSVKNTASLDYSYNTKTPLTTTTSSTAIKNTDQTVHITNKLIPKAKGFKPQDEDVIWEIYVTNHMPDTAARKSLYINPIVLDQLPKQIVAGNNPTVSVELGKVAQPGTGKIVDASTFLSSRTLGSNEYGFDWTPTTTAGTLLKWNFAGMNLGYLDTIKITIRTDVSFAADPGTYTNKALTTSNIQKLQQISGTTESSTQLYKDFGVSGANLYFSNANITIDSNGKASIQKSVHGSADKAGVLTMHPNTGLTTPGGTATYQVLLKNYSANAIKNIKIADLLPFEGDRSIYTKYERGSAWKPYFIGITSPANGSPKIYAKTAVDGDDRQITATENDLVAGTPDSSWKLLSSLSVAEKKNVSSLLLDFSTFELAPGGRIEFNIEIGIPADVPLSKLPYSKDDKVAWGSVALGYTDLSGKNQILSDPTMCGVKAVGTDLTIDKEVFKYNGTPLATATDTFKFDIEGPNNFKESKEITGAGSAYFASLYPGEYTITETITTVGAPLYELSTRTDVKELTGNVVKVDVKGFEGNSNNTKNDNDMIIGLSNTRQEHGSLKINKAVLLETGIATDTDSEYANAEYKFTITDPDGEKLRDDDGNEFFVIRTVDGEGSLELNDLAFGEYIVEELDKQAKFVVLGEGSVTVNSNDVTAEKTIVNQHKKGLIFTKALDDAYQVTGQEFKFEITSAPDGFDADNREFTLTRDSSQIFLDAPEGTYNFREVFTGAKPYETSAKIDATALSVIASGTDADGNDFVEFEFEITDARKIHETGVVIETTNKRVTDGNILVNKILQDANGAAITDWDTYNFAIRVKGRDIAYDRTLTVNNSTRNVLFDNLPYGVYDITELNSTGYIVTVTPGTVTINKDTPKDASILVAVTNRQDNPPPPPTVPDDPTGGPGPGPGPGGPTTPSSDTPPPTVPQSSITTQRYVPTNVDNVFQLLDEDSTPLGYFSPNPENPEEMVEVDEEGVPLGLGKVNPKTADYDVINITLILGLILCILLEGKEQYNKRLKKVVA